MLPYRPVKVEIQKGYHFVFCGVEQSIVGQLNVISQYCFGPTIDCGTEQKTNWQPPFEYYLDGSIQ